MEAVMDPDSLRDLRIEKLIRLYQVPLLRLCYVQLWDKALAEDAVQESNQSFQVCHFSVSLSYGSDH